MLRCSVARRLSLRLVSGIVLVIVTLEKAWGETFTEFDGSVLEARGIDPGVAEHFRAAPRFQAGRSRVLLQVNGTTSGQVLATFDEQGQLCLDANLLDHAAIVAPRMCPNVPMLRSVCGLSMSCSERKCDLIRACSRCRC